MTTVQDLISLGAVGVVLVAITQFLKEKEYFEEKKPTTETKEPKEEVKCPECSGCGLWFWIGMLGIIVLAIQLIAAMSTGGFFENFFLFQALSGLLSFIGSLLRA